MKKLILTSAIVAGMIAGQAIAEEATGRDEYMIACAGCHGETALGDGPLANLLKIGTPNLKGLAARNDGKFPYEYTLFMIDRRDVLAVHGGDMPVWGDRYTASATSQRGETAEMVARGRILSLVYYLESIQQ